MSETAAPSRRELNKTANRDAIATAALELLRSRGMGEFTVDDIATAASVSRRTFFNYFSSAEAAIASFTQKYLDSVIEQLLRRPFDEPLLESAQHALTAVGSPHDLAILAETYALTQDYPQLSRYQLQAWDDCSASIISAATNRLGNVGDELYLHALVGSIIASGRAAVEVWFRQRGPDTSDDSLAALRQLLFDAVGHLRNGFAQ